MNIKHLAVIVSLLLIACGVFLGVDIFYKVAATRMTPAPVESPLRRNDNPAGNALRRPSLSQYRMIAQRNLFRIDAGGEATDAPPPIDIDNLKETQLKLKLWGTVSGQEQEAYAVIEDSQSRRQNLYRVGDAIQNATLKMILREKVVLRVEDRDEVLQMEKVQSGPGPGSRPAATVAAAPQSVRSRTIRLRQKMLEGMVKEGEDPLQDLKAEPHQTDGATDGVVLTGIQPRSIFRRLGLRNGDVITAIDGESVQSVDKLTMIYEKLVSGSGLSLELNRRGRPTTLEYQAE